MVFDDHLSCRFGLRINKVMLADALGRSEPMIDFAIQLKHQREFEKCRSQIPDGSVVVGEEFWDPEDMVDAFACLHGQGPTPQPEYQNGRYGNDHLRCVTVQPPDGYGDIYFWYEPPKENQ